MKYIFFNPFFMYFIINVIILALYSLPFSSNNMPLDNEYITFNFISLFIILCIGILFHKRIKRIINKDKLKPRSLSILTHNCFFILLLIAWFADFYLSGYIPIVNVIIKSYGHDYHNFGVKTLHPILVSLSYLILTVSFFNFIVSNKNRKSNLLKFVVILTIFIAIYSRAFIFFSLASMSLLFIAVKIKKINISMSMFLSIALIVLLFLFGYMGDKRSPSPEYTYKNIFNVTQTFYATAIPKEFMWSYIYITSPIANTNLNLINHRDSDDTFENILLTYVFPDFVNKHLIKTDFDKVVPNLNVATYNIYGVCYGGVLGLYLSFFIFMLYILIPLYFVIRFNDVVLLIVSIIPVYLSFFTNLFMGALFFISIFLLIVSRFRFRSSSITDRNQKFCNTHL